MVFGTRTEGDTTRYFEVTPEGEVVWDIELCPGGWDTYRVERILRDVPIGQQVAASEEELRRDSCFPQMFRTAPGHPNQQRGTGVPGRRQATVSI